MKITRLDQVKAPREAHELLTLRDAAARFGVDYRLIWALAHAGYVHPVRPGRRLLYPAWEIAEALVKATYRVAAEAA